jgi:hypothetical protein
MKREFLDKIFYSLSHDDIQNIAEQDLGRELTESEIESVVDEISKRISWAEVISDVLLDRFEPAGSDDNVSVQ